MVPDGHKCKKVLRGPTAGLPFLRGKPTMKLWSALRLTPRADLALPVVSATGRAFYLRPMVLGLMTPNPPASANR